LTDQTTTKLKETVLKANIDLVKAGLVVLTWGNASAVDRDRGIIAIKPSRIPYETMTADDIVLVSLQTGQPLPGERLQPSSDTATHVYLYQNFKRVGGIVHTHSRLATSWAQACRPIPCYGTTHADTFHGEVPLVRFLTPTEVDNAYEMNTGVAIVEHFLNKNIDPVYMPGALLPFHAPFTWGTTVSEAVENSIILEEVAGMAMRTESLKASADLIPEAISKKHFTRKHGIDAYYGQNN
jgi:L-ribulose-5-phosphate 4-epimerase